ncbi:MAG: hypothetical protein ACK4MF_01535 [Hyphomicrobiaceae bacterium]
MARSVASASKSKSKKAQKKMNEAIVDRYLSELSSAVGQDEAFSSVFGRIKSDPAVTQVEAVALASRFVAPMAQSTPKKRALERIEARHESLSMFKNKQRAVGGRSAA